jgi:hypothetical protein
LVLRGEGEEQLQQQEGTSVLDQSLHHLLPSTPIMPPKPNAKPNAKPKPKPKPKANAKAKPNAKPKPKPKANAKAKAKPNAKHDQQSSGGIAIHEIEYETLNASDSASDVELTPAERRTLRKKQKQNIVHNNALPWKRLNIMSSNDTAKEYVIDGDNDALQAVLASGYVGLEVIDGSHFSAIKVKPPKKSKANNKSATAKHPNNSSNKQAHQKHDDQEEEEEIDDMDDSDDEQQQQVVVDPVATRIKQALVTSKSKTQKKKEAAAARAARAAASATTNKRKRDQTSHQATHAAKRAKVSEEHQEQAEDEQLEDEHQVDDQDDQVDDDDDNQEHDEANSDSDQEEDEDALCCRQDFDASGLVVEGMQHWEALAPNIDKRILKALAALNFQQPTQIQQQALPIALMPRSDLLIAAETVCVQT